MLASCLQKNLLGRVHFGDEVFVNFCYAVAHDFLLCRKFNSNFKGLGDYFELVDFFEWLEAVLGAYKFANFFSYEFYYAFAFDQVFVGVVD